MNADEDRGQETPSGDLAAKVERLSRRVDGLSGRVDGLSGRVDGLSGRVDGLSGKIDGLSATVDERFTKIDERFTGIDERFTGIDEQIRTAAAETRRHFDVVAEGLKASIKVIAEGYGHHTTVLDDHEARLTNLEQARLRFDG